MEAGCDDFIRKPYQSDELLNSLTRNMGVRFVYEKETMPAALAPFDAAALIGLPHELRHKLEQALLQLDINAVRYSIEEIRTVEPVLADKLTAMAEELRFGQMLRMLRTTLS